MGDRKRGRRIGWVRKTTETRGRDHFDVEKPKNILLVEKSQVSAQGEAVPSSRPLLWLLAPADLTNRSPHGHHNLSSADFRLATILRCYRFAVVSLHGQTSLP